MLRAREALRAEFALLHRQLLAIVHGDATCRRLMTAPGVGAVVAATFTSAVDDPGRFAESKSVGAHFGLTPRRYQSGETDVAGGISRVGDAMARTALYEAAQLVLTRTTRLYALKRWALEPAKRRGMRRAEVALARELAAALRQALAPPELSRFYAERGLLAACNPPEAVRANMVAETASWTEVIRQADIRLD